MPWRETSAMENRLRFVARLLEGEGMSEVYRDFGISRETGDKFFDQLQAAGAGGADGPITPSGELCQSTA